MSVLLIVEMYAGRVACWPLTSHGKYTDGTDRQTDKRMDARPLHYAFRKTASVRKGLQISIHVQ